MINQGCRPIVAYAIDCDSTMLRNNSKWPPDMFKYLVNLPFPPQPGVVGALIHLACEPTARIAASYTARDEERHFPTVVNLGKIGVPIDRVIHTPGHNGVGSRLKVQQVLTDIAATKDAQGNPITFHGLYVPDETVARVALIDDDAKHVVLGINYLLRHVPALAPLLSRFTFIHFNPSGKRGRNLTLPAASGVEYLEMCHWDELSQIHEYLASNLRFANS